MAATTGYSPKLQEQNTLEHDLTLRTKTSKVEAEKMDSSEDNDLDGEDVDDDFTDEYDADAGSVVGVSIGRAQVEMKSPTTPAATKAQALEASQSYFVADPDGQNHIFEEPQEQQISSQGAMMPETTKNQVVSAKSASPPRPAARERSQGRSFFVSSILGATNNNSRPRSSSGSSIVDNIRKRIPGLPSISLPKFYGSSDEGKKALDSGEQGIVILNMQRKELQQGVSRQTACQLADTASRTRTNQSAMSNEKGRPSGHSSMPGILRRATSNQSLYLRREATGASDFDDYTAFSNVSEQVNSRFKAITDSFQDSALRMPKFSSISGASSQDQSGRTNSNETKGGTRSDANDTQPKDMLGNRAQTVATDLTTSKHPILKEALLKMSGDVVIMGGYRGSILREAHAPHRQLWVPIKVGMNLRKADLEVGLTRDDELRMAERIIPDGILSHIGPIDICRRLLRKIKHCPNVREGKLKLHDYGYDWRLSPDLLSDRLIQYLENLPCNRPEVPAEQRGAWVVAHSLGGLITRHAVNRRPELFAGVVYAGTPQNCVNILGPLRNGDDVLFSSRVLTAQVNFTLRTSYALLPQDGRCFINKQTGERYDVDFFDPKAWEEYRLSPCIKSPLYRTKPEKKASIIGSISEALIQPGKRSSWFGPFTGEDSTASQTASSTSPENVMEDAAREIEGVAEAMKPERPLSPTMQDGSSLSAKHKPSIATQCTIPLPLAMAYLSTTLQSVLEFKHSLNHIPETQQRNAYPPASILYAKNTPTVYGAFVNSREAIKYDDAFDDLAFAAGDGVVLASAAQLPLGYRCVRNGRVESDRGHVGLLGDLEGVGKCLNAVIDARRRGVGIGAYDR